MKTRLQNRKSRPTAQILNASLITIGVIFTSAALAEPTNSSYSIPATPSLTDKPRGALMTDAAKNVLKLSASNVSDDLMTSYIENVPSAFNLSPDNIVYLRSQNFPERQITAMIDHDRLLKEKSGVLSPAPATTVPPAADQNYQPDQSASAQPAQYDNSDDNSPQAAGYFNNALSPYGTWSDMPGYGQYWQPSVAASDRAWTPYLDNGQWVNTDAGWYWNSAYPWGWAAFHYGRWLNDSEHGWVWFPGKTWSPAWVTWRSSANDIGWAPLPPGSSFDSKAGFRFKNQSVARDFDFGLKPNDFVFVNSENFGSQNLRQTCLNPQQATQAFANTKVVNDFTAGANGILMNRGIDVASMPVTTRDSIRHANLKESPSLANAGFLPATTSTPSTSSTLNVFRPRVNFTPGLMNNPQPTSRQSATIPPQNPAATTQPPINTSQQPLVPNRNNQTNAPVPPANVGGNIGGQTGNGAGTGTGNRPHQIQPQQPQQQP